MRFADLWTWNNPKQVDMSLKSIHQNQLLITERYILSLRAEEKYLKIAIYSTNKD